MELSTSCKDVPMIMMCKQHTSLAALSLQNGGTPGLAQLSSPICWSLWISQQCLYSPILSQNVPGALGNPSNVVLSGTEQVREYSWELLSWWELWQAGRAWWWEAALMGKITGEATAASGYVSQPWRAVQGGAADFLSSEVPFHVR